MSHNNVVEDARKKFRACTTMPVFSRIAKSAIQTLIWYKDFDTLPQVVKWLHQCKERKTQQNHQIDKDVLNLISTIEGLLEQKAGRESPAPEAVEATVILDDEHVLPDNYPMYHGYVYVIDGKPGTSMFIETTVGTYKQKTGAKEVRKCSLVDRQLKGLPPYSAENRRSFHV